MTMHATFVIEMLSVFVVPFGESAINGGELRAAIRCAPRLPPQHDQTRCAGERAKSQP